MKRTLSLTREALARLTGDDLVAVVGGAAYSNQGPTCGGVRECAGTVVDPSPLTQLTLDSRYCNTFPYC